MERIIEYFVKEKGYTNVVAGMLTKPIIKYTDIQDEFLLWMDKRTYDIDNPLEVKGYTAKMISEIAPFLDGSGVYGFMVTLRDNPEKAKEYIEKGFPRK